MAFSNFYTIRLISIQISKVRHKTIAYFQFIFFNEFSFYNLLKQYCRHLISEECSIKNNTVYCLTSSRQLYNRSKIGNSSFTFSKFSVHVQ